MSEQYLINGQTLTNIADAIREKSGQTGNIKAGEFAGKILELEITASGSNYVEAVSYGDYGEYDYISVSGVNFQPRTIVATNARQLYDFDDYGRAIGGFMYAAFYDDNEGWIVAAPKYNSGTMHILQESFETHELVPELIEEDLFLYFGQRGEADHGGSYVDEYPFKVRIYG